MAQAVVYPAEMCAVVGCAAPAPQTPFSLGNTDDRPRGQTVGEGRATSAGQATQAGHGRR